MDFVSAIHLSELPPKCLITFVLTGAEQGAKHGGADYFHLEQPISAKKRSPQDNTQQMKKGLFIAPAWLKGDI